MGRTNTEIVRGFIEAINQNQFDRLFEFASPDSRSHGSPYVGLGIMLDDSSGDRVTIASTAPGGPADGVLQRGDILMKVTDGMRTWSTFAELKSSEWGQGVRGTPLTLTVKRDSQALDFHLLRGQIPGWEQKLSDFIDYWREYKLRVWPDLKTDIQFIFEKDDLVAFYAIDTGTNLEYGRTATWGECTICRVRDGKIVESWSTEDIFSQMKQLGYEIREPQAEHAG